MHPKLSNKQCTNYSSITNALLCVYDMYMFRMNETQKVFFNEPKSGHFYDINFSGSS